MPSTKVASAGLSGSGVLTWSVQSTNFTAVANNGYYVNTTSAAITITLPATPSAGNSIGIVDYSGTFDTNALTINPNGNKIESGTASLQLTGEREGVTLNYIDATQGWLCNSGINEGTDALSPLPYSIDFLVVAGGGSGGQSTGSPVPTAGGGGGGGAGGFRTSTQSANIGTVITVTVGDGGATGNNSGSNSSISGSGLTTITSAGGGNGGGDTAASGGSGGGGSAITTAGASGNTPSTSPSQGSAGGNGLSSNPTCVGGGGGGAGQVGGNGSVPFTGGNGGNGTASSITGSSVTYAGGGGGGARNATGGASTAGTGGTGGGGTGAKELAPNQAPTAGTVNTGGGGGGNHIFVPVAIASGAGGKGVVILSVPTVSYSGTTSGSPTTTTFGSNTILQFNGSGSYTA